MNKRKAMSNKHVDHRHKKRANTTEILTTPLNNLDSLIDIAKQNNIKISLNGNRK